MRLINATTLQLEGPFFGSNRPSYAILSHTWGSEELCLQDMANVGQQIYKAGFKKIARCCGRAQQDGFTHVWVDTVCIDKTSSAELSEAINSMYNWYARADACYILLEDYSLDTIEPGSSTLKDCRWFTRGWTLQELIASRKATFFNQEWHLLGQKSDPPVTRAVSLITGIDHDTLLGITPRRLGVAQRMSWAAKRQTSRPEDSAYCLLGIFGINMPMLYGEGGENAFRRLQEEILKKTDDQSIFAWEAEPAGEPDCWGLLAPSPRCFVNSAKFRSLKMRPDQMRPNVLITSRGISLSLPVDQKVGLAGLACLDDTNHICLIRLVRLGTGPNEFARASRLGISYGKFHYREKIIFFRLDVQSADFRIENMSNYMRISFVAPQYQRYYHVVMRSSPPEALEITTSTMRTSPFLQDRVALFVHFQPRQLHSSRRPFCLGLFCTGASNGEYYEFVLELYRAESLVSNAEAAISTWIESGRPMGLPGALRDFAKTENGNIMSWCLDKEIMVNIVDILEPLDAKYVMSIVFPPDGDPVTALQLYGE